jgi:cyanate lyase
MSNNKLYTEEQVRNSMNSMKTYIEKYNENVIDKIAENHIRALGGIETKRTLIIYNTKETTEDEARHLLEILNCDDSTLWDNADHCGVQVLEVPIQGGNK